MKEQLNWFCFGAIVMLIFIGVVHGCEDKKQVPKTVTKIEKQKAKIDTVKIEVIKWKESKTKIVYRTKFDSTATIDTVLVELNKCDTIVKIDSIIIQKQDTIIKGQEEIISDQDLENQHLTKEVKKAKRKLLFTKIAAGVLIIVTILLTK